MAVSLVGGTVRAADGDPEPEPGLAPADLAQGLLAEGLCAGQESIDLSAVGLPREELGEVFSWVMNDRPELFFVESHLSYTYDGSGSVLTVTPAYRMAGEELEAAQELWQTVLAEVGAALCEAQMAALLAAEALPAGEVRPWGEADTVLFLHDYLAETYEYDTTATRYDALRLFRDGVGVCQAYALAFMALGRAAGLEVDMVVSREMDHAWNHVRVDGVWYHVDVTRDDPIREPGSRSVVRHDRLLRSDAGMEALGYRGFSCAAGHTCPGTRYETESGEALLSGIREGLTHLGTGWFRPVADGLWEPVPFPVPCETVAGDMDGDGRICLRDLLYLEICTPPADLSAARAAWRNLYWSYLEGTDPAG